MTNLHLANARIWTADPDQPTASSMTIRGGRIVALDTAPTDEPVIDCQGDVITPGLIDSHMHLLLGGASLETLDLSIARSRDEFEALLADAHASLPPDTWLLGHGWSQDNWPGNAMPDLEWLRGAEDRPVVCWRTDWHAALVNAPVLHECRLPDDDTLEQEGGRQMRFSDGRPNGLLLEAAAWNHLQPKIPKPSPARSREHLLAAQRHAHALGLTAVRSMEYTRDILDVFEPMRDNLTLRCSLVLLDRELPLDLDWVDGFTQDEVLSISGCKTFIDGTIGSRSARMIDAWDDRPGDHGMLVELALAGRLEEWLDSVHASGLDAAAHAIGDAAVRIAIDLHERAGDGRLTIEHGEILHPDDLDRVDGAWFSMQPLHRADDGRGAVAAMGTTRAAWLAPFRSLQRAGARFAFGSDWPIVSCDPILGLRSAVTGKTIDGEAFHCEQAIDVETAILAYTSNAAACCRLEGCGVLGPGGFGDCVRWTGDPMRVGCGGEHPTPHLTICSGVVVYDARTRTE